jgi:hypothetical protein
LFVENNIEYASVSRRAGCEVVHTDYPTTRGVTAPDIAPPRAVAETEWDMVLIDGPGPKGKPGRELPYRWTSMMGNSPLVAAHDLEKPMGAWLSDKYLGPPDFFLRGNDAHRGEMGLWWRGRASAADLFV